MNIFIRFLLVIFLAIGFAGCKQSTPSLRMDTKAGDAVKEAGGPEVIGQVGPNAQIVTGQNATTLDDQPTDPSDTAATGEDKAGAVGMKMEY